MAMDPLAGSLYVPDYIKALQPYVPGKPIAETQREFKIKRVYKLASNENPLGPSPKAVNAIKKQCKEMHRYPDASGFALKQALSKFLKVEPTAISLGNGSNELIDLMIRTYCASGDAIVTSEAAFIAYAICAQTNGVRTIKAPLTSDYRFDLSAMLERVKSDDRVRLVFLANPNNPTGTYNTKTEMKMFLDELQKIRGGTVLCVLDAAYYEYVTAKDLPDSMELLKHYPSLVVLRTFSKIYGLAGLRVGYAVAKPELITHLEKVRMPFNVSAISMFAAEAALGDEAFVRRSKSLNSLGMKFWERSLKEMKVPYYKSQGNFILIDAHAGFGMTGADLFHACLKRGIIFRPVANYGLHHALRISIGTAAENQAAVKALKMEKPKHAPKKV